MRRWLINVVIGIAVAVGTIVTFASGLASLPHLADLFAEAVSRLHFALSAKQASIFGGVGLGIALAVFLLESRRGRGFIRRPIAAVAVLWMAISLGVIVAPYRLSTHSSGSAGSKEKTGGGSSKNGSPSLGSASSPAGRGGRVSIAVSGSQAEGQRVPLSASKSSALPCGCSTWRSEPSPQREVGGWNEPEEEGGEGSEEEEWGEEEGWGEEESWGSEEGWEEEGSAAWE